MRKLVISEFISVDGVFGDPGGSEKSRYGGWSFEFASDQSMKYKYDELVAADALLLGRKTYEGFAEAWPKMKDTGMFGKLMNGLPKYVVSSTLSKLDWNNSSFIKGDLIMQLKKLKKQPGKNVLVAGSGQLANFLLENKLVDELNLMVHPVVLGSGKLFFKDTSRKTPMVLKSIKKFPKGTIVLSYVPTK